MSIDKLGLLLENKILGPKVGKGKEEVERKEVAEEDRGIGVGLTQDKGTLG